MSAPRALAKGQNLTWQASRVDVRVSTAQPCDLSVLLLGVTDVVRTSDDFVFYNQPTAAGVGWSGAIGGTQQISLSLNHIDDAVATLRCVVSVDDDQPAFGAQPPVTVWVVDPSGAEAPISFSPSGLSSERALAAVEVYRRGEAWKVRAVGQGWDGGLAQCVRLHGVEVDDEPTPATPLPPSYPGPAPLPAPDAGTVDRYLRIVTGIMDDLARSRAAFDSTRRYADEKLTGAREHAAELRASGSAASAPELLQNHDALLRQAAAQHRRDVEQLQMEIHGLEAELPHALARLDSPRWRSDVNPSGTPVPEAIRVGALHLNGEPEAKVPLLLPFPGRPIGWLDRHENAPEGVAFAAGLITRVLATSTPARQGETPPVEVHLADLQGLLLPRIPSRFAGGITPVPTRQAVAQLMRSLSQRVDMVKMALESGVHGALDDVAGLPPVLAVIHGFPSVVDPGALPALEQVAQFGRYAGVQLVLIGDDEDLVSERVDPRLADVVASSLWLSLDGKVPIVDASTDSGWILDPELVTDEDWHRALG